MLKNCLQQKFLFNIKKLLTVLVAAAVYSCGFQVIYKEKQNDSDDSYIEQLSAIRIKKNRTKLDQDLKNNLYDLLNPDYTKSEAKYFLSITVKRSVLPTFITLTGASGRNRITLIANYRLENLKTGALISSGSTSVNDNYDVTNNRYATYTTEQYLQTNLTKLAAQNIRNSLVNDFIEAKKKCTKSDENKNENTSLCPL